VTVTSRRKYFSQLRKLTAPPAGLGGTRAFTLWRLGSGGVLPQRVWVLTWS